MLPHLPLRQTINPRDLPWCFPDLTHSPQPLPTAFCPRSWAAAPACFLPAAHTKRPAFAPRLHPAFLHCLPSVPARHASCFSPTQRLFPGPRHPGAAQSALAGQHKCHVPACSRPQAMPACLPLCKAQRVRELGGLRLAYAP